MRIVLFIILLSVTGISYAKVKAWENDAAPLHRAQKALTDVIVHDIFSPPVASRIYAYTNLAAYEVLVQQNVAYRSLHKQLNSFPQVPAATGKVSASLAA